MHLTYVKHSPLSLQNHPHLSENWLHDLIAKDPAILGLGELEVIHRERVQYAGGRLDMLLGDRLADTRYEVEIMLGATDPSHIIRCLEYWDIERRRYPAYDHIAVLIAEDITSRFLNVIGLFAGAIPIIAIQLNAIQSDNSVFLNFVKVLDQRQLRTEDPPDAGDGDVDRSYWEAKTGSANMQICDWLAETANEVAVPQVALKFKKGHMALAVPGSFFNLIALYPKRNFVPIRMQVSNLEEWIKELDDAGLDVESKRGKVLLRLQPKDVHAFKDPLRELIHQSIKEQQE